jgi:Archaeal fructose-1,6-bisphosphatase and related enzymes of inositol monophosphatase family
MRREQVRILAEIIGEVRDIRRMGTASLDLAAVAAGRVDVYFERTLNPWDHAAGELLVTEAGGVIAGIRDLPQGREGIFAGHPTTGYSAEGKDFRSWGDKLLHDVPGWGLE